jgi:hypothetical protein
MDFEDLFERKHHHAIHGRDGQHDDHDGDALRIGEHRHYDQDVKGSPSSDKGYRRSSHHDGHHDSLGDSGGELSKITRQLAANKTVLIIAAISALLLLAIAAFLLLPLLGEVFGLIDKNGIRGMVERLWLGAGK